MAVGAGGQIKLAAELKVTQQALNDANERQKARTALTEQLKKLAEKKAAVKTPAQALKALPSVLPLPVPIAFDEGEAARATPGAQSRVTAPPEIPDGECPAGFGADCQGGDACG